MYGKGAYWSSFQGFEPIFGSIKVKGRIRIRIKVTSRIRILTKVMRLRSIALHMHFKTAFMFLVKPIKKKPSKNFFIFPEVDFAAYYILSYYFNADPVLDWNCDK
jgi:hypothetical protein